MLMEVYIYSRMLPGCSTCPGRYRGHRRSTLLYPHFWLDTWVEYIHTYILEHLLPNQEGRTALQETCFPGHYLQVLL